MESDLMEFFVAHPNKWWAPVKITSMIDLSNTSVYKACNQLYEHGIIEIRREGFGKMFYRYNTEEDKDV